MVITVSVLVLTAFVVLTWVLVSSARRFLRWIGSNSGATPMSARTPPAYGALHGPADPVGLLGHPAPQTQLPDDPGSSEDLYGE